MEIGTHGRPPDALSDKGRGPLTTATAMDDHPDVEALRPLEIVQAGDTFLMRLICPGCGMEAMTSAQHPRCHACERDYSSWPIVAPIGRRARRCLSGTRRPRSISVRIVRKLMALFGNDCAYCGQEMAEIHIEHIIPLSFGGTSQISNLVLSCATCNLLAGSLVFSGFAAKRDWIVARRFSKRFGICANNSAAGSPKC